MLFAFASAKVQLILYLTNIILIFLRRDRKKFHIHTKKAQRISLSLLLIVRNLSTVCSIYLHKRMADGTNRYQEDFYIISQYLLFRYPSSRGLISVYVSLFVKYVYPLSCTRHGLLSLTFLVLFNLAKQRINAEVNTFFKRVAHLFCVQVCSWK